MLPVDNTDESGCGDAHPYWAAVRYDSGPMIYERPTSATSIAQLLSHPGAVALGGGTDLLVNIREGLVQANRVVDLSGLPDSDVMQDLPDDGLRIGAGVRIATMAEDVRVRQRFPALSMACASVGSPALRNMGTLGGNLCQRPRCWYFRSGIPCLKSTGSSCPAATGENTHHAIFGGGACFAVSPSDPAVALVALGAAVDLHGPDGQRSIPLDEFFVLPGADPRRETSLDTGEFIASVTLPAHSSGGRQWYRKVLQRGAWDFALASIAAIRQVDGSVRMVLGGVAHVPWRISSSVEEDVASAPLSVDDLDVLAERALYDAKPLAKNGYKVALAKALLVEAMSELNQL
jgi:xanthine dehydrogenase YagS FAD-binding subunit